MSPALVIVVHDLAPATWPECEGLLSLLAELGRPPVTLLAVPRYHGGKRIGDAPGLVRAVEGWLAHGAEVALHGYRHADDGPAPRTAAEWFFRRVLTAGEGEFSTLGPDEAAARIERGRAMLAGLGWSVRGFVAPAWLAGPGARQALRASSLAYTSSHHALIRLADDARLPAPCLTASSRSAWRRAASRAWLTAAEAATMRAPLVRVGLHPADARDAAVMDHWRSLLTRLLARREPLTKTQALERFACAARR